MKNPTLVIMAAGIGSRFGDNIYHKTQKAYQRITNTIFHAVLVSKRRVFSENR